MRLRKELEPQLEQAKKLYPEVLKLVMDYAAFCDEHGDEEKREYTRLDKQLQVLTGKDISKFDLWEWWEEEGAEVLAFRIALPDPNELGNLTKDEVLEIVKRIVIFEKSYETDGSFGEQFKYHLEDYYHELLAINLETYDRQFFMRQKDSSGSYAEYSVAQIVEKIYQKKI
jgi:hypothetical protein